MRVSRTPRGGELEFHAADKAVYSIFLPPPSHLEEDEEIKGAFCSSKNSSPSPERRESIHEEINGKKEVKGWKSRKRRRKERRKEQKNGKK